MKIKQVEERLDVPRTHIRYLQREGMFTPRAYANKYRDFTEDDIQDLEMTLKKNALVIDFFAGSGTTLHAVNLLNEEDEGRRRCILVTNNEVSVDESKALTEAGFHPGDEEWEKLGIARYVTWPRTVTLQDWSTRILAAKSG